MLLPLHNSYYYVLYKNASFTDSRSHMISQNPIFWFLLRNWMLNKKPVGINCLCFDSTWSAAKFYIGNRERQEKMRTSVLRFASIAKVNEMLKAFLLLNNEISICCTVNLNVTNMIYDRWNWQLNIIYRHIRVYANVTWIIIIVLIDNGIKIIQ